MDKEATTGERIRQMRLARGMTQDQLSSAAGISKGFLSDVENGKRDISSRNLLRIATALSASVDYLLQGVFCPACEAAARELADIAAVLRTGSPGNTPLAREVSHWVDTAHGAEQERDDLHTLCDKQADILSRVAVALRGPEPPQTKWSHHDLPERAAKIKQEIAHLRAGILRVIEDYPRAIKQDAEEALRALADGVAASMSSNSDLWAHPIICACGDHIGYAESIGLSQDGAVCGNCAVGRTDYDARTELTTLRAGIAEVLDMYPQSIEQGPQDELRDLLRKDAK